VDHLHAVVYCGIVNEIEEGLVPFLDCSLVMVNILLRFFIKDGIVYLKNERPT